MVSRRCRTLCLHILGRCTTRVLHIRIVIRTTTRMCYHKTFIFTVCGHIRALPVPTKQRCPPCPSQGIGLIASPTLSSPVADSFDHEHQYGRRPGGFALEAACHVLKPPSVSDAAVEGSDVSRCDALRSSASPHICIARLTHPVQTYRIDSLCQACAVIREQRLARFEANAIKSELDREVLRRRQQSKAQQQLRRTVDSLRAGSGLQSYTGGWRPLKLGSSLSGNEHNDGGSTKLSSFAFGRVKHNLKEWTSPMVTAALLSKTEVQSSPLNWNRGVTTGPEAGGASSNADNWLGSPRLRNPVNLTLTRSQGPYGHTVQDEEVLSPEHFAVLASLHDSQESLTTEGTSRRESYDTRVSLAHQSTRRPDVVSLK